jgi:hypothetical protein
MTDEEIINNVLEDDNSENEQESSTPPIIRTVLHDAMMPHFFCKNTANDALNIELMDKNSQYTFIYVK